ncbi:unnamed protein product, partial [Darwinula stevensoni]
MRGSGSRSSLNGIVSPPPGPLSEMEHIISALERGTVVYKFYVRKRPEKGQLSIRRETRQVIWKKAVPTSTAGSGKFVFDGAIDMHELKEVRVTRSSKEFDRWQDDTRRNDAQWRFVLLYGMEFRMKTCSLVALTERECHMWVKALRHLAEDTRKASYPLQLERWLRKEFYSMENPHGTVSV